MDAPPPPEPPEQPNQPPSKGGFKGKRSKKRAHSRNQRSGSKNQKRSSTPDPAAEEMIPPARSVPSKATVYVKTKKEEFASMLDSCRAELHAANTEISRKDTLIARLNKQIEQLTETIKAARQSAREAKQLAREVEKKAEGETKKLKVEASVAQEQLQSIAIDLESKTALEVDEVRRLEKVSLPLHPFLQLLENNNHFCSISNNLRKGVIELLL